MTDKILEAVKALGGDINNIKTSDGRKSNYVALCTKYCDDPISLKGEYWDVLRNCDSLHFDVVCSAYEFNTYAEQWLKEAYMHNAALDCNWDLYYRDGSKLICTSDDIVVHFDVDVCTEQEFINYCNANKPCEEAKPEWDGEGLPPVGSEVTLEEETGFYSDWLGKITKKQAGQLCTVVGYAERIDNKAKLVTLMCSDDADCGFVSICSQWVNPIKSPRDKAIESIQGSISLRARDGASVIAEELYDWLKQLTPEQKKEFGL